MCCDVTKFSGLAPFALAGEGRGGRRRGGAWLDQLRCCWTGKLAESPSRIVGQYTPDSQRMSWIESTVTPVNSSKRASPFAMYCSASRIVWRSCCCCSCVGGFWGWMGMMVWVLKLVWRYRDGVTVTHRARVPITPHPAFHQTRSITSGAPLGRKIPIALVPPERDGVIKPPNLSE